jgi:hypothetical protein
MGLIFRRRVSLGPVRLNVSRSGLGVSVGVPGFRTGVRSNGRRYSRVSLPGTGLGYHTEHGAARGRSNPPRATTPTTQGQGCAIVLLLAAGGAAVATLR